MSIQWAAELQDRLIEQLIISTRERKIQEVLLEKDAKLKLDKATDIARTREATVNNMKSLEQQGASASACSHDITIDAIRQNSNPRCGKCGLSHEKVPSSRNTSEAAWGLDTTGQDKWEQGTHSWRDKLRLWWVEFWDNSDWQFQCYSSKRWTFCKAPSKFA